MSRSGGLTGKLVDGKVRVPSQLNMSESYEDDFDDFDIGTSVSRPSIPNLDEINWTSTGMDASNHQTISSPLPRSTISKTSVRELFQLSAHDIKILFSNSDFFFSFFLWENLSFSCRLDVEPTTLW
jgi:hypothetical protein